MFWGVMLTRASHKVIQWYGWRLLGLPSIRLDSITSKEVREPICHHKAETFTSILLPGIRHILSVCVGPVEPS